MASLLVAHSRKFHRLYVLVPRPLSDPATPSAGTIIIQYSMNASLRAAVIVEWRGLPERKRDPTVGNARPS